MSCVNIGWALLTRNRISDLVNSIGAANIPDHQKSLILEIVAEDVTEEDVEVPYVKVNL